ncbi:MAG: AAA family ATPase [Pseudohongiellaceae bacterium]
MNKYNDWLDLDFDPFAPASKSRDFYCSGHRQELLDQIVELSLYSNAMIAVTGPLGAGKTTLATNFRARFAEEAVCVKIAATMFMNQSQFLDSLQEGLPFNTASDAGIDEFINQICHYAAELDLEARSLILIIDDAHELSAEVLLLLTQLLERSVDSSIHALLFGENQLDNLLQNTLSDAAQERLAVFPLDGFASDETHEYIRFKMLSAGYSKELPVSGGVVGAIHNSSQGMPGKINSLIAEALNSAAPGDDSHDFSESEDFGPLFGDGSIEHLYDDERHETVRQQNAAPEGAWFASMQPKYWAATATLIVLLAVTLLFWDSGPDEIASQPIAVAVTPTAAQSEQAESSGPVPLQSTQAAAVIAPVEEVIDTESEEPAQASAPAALVSTNPVVVDHDKPEIVVPAPQAEPQAVLVPAPKTAELASATSFEEQLLQAPSGNFAVQLLASHSEANIKQFVAQFERNQPAGYFETRYQGKPWFVAVLGAFDDRNLASQAIAALPAQLRSNQPWIRSLAGIQNDIRELQSAKLVSAQ